uniref:Major capsid protein n=1 Tax=Microviridae sp. cthcR2 TaxID=2826741 RepID=A0A8S5NN69_9VIRU|nr:MAG TPA: Major capsid protein [Microviridae sp. cthcR2]
MSLFSLKDIRNHPRRSAFDLSSKVAFSAKSGELLPIKWYFTMPGDKFSLKRQHFTRTQPVNTSAYTRIREYYDWFWVPLHLLWRNAPEVISQMQSNVQHASSQFSSLTLGSYLPTITNSQLKACLSNLKGKTNYFGFDRSDLSYKLLQYLRFGNCSGGNEIFGTSVKYSTSYSQDFRFDLNLSVFPLLAYKKFCQDYFRYSQWQDSSPYLWNIDYFTGVSQKLFNSIPSSSDSYWKNNTLFDLEYCNWNKDMFMGVLPDTQFGDVVSINTGGLDAQDLYVEAKTSSSDNARLYLGDKITTNGSNFAINAGPSAVASNPLVVSMPSVASSFDVLALRRGEALQRWKEISLNVPQNYRAQIKAHFGVDVGENMSGMSTYVGGDSSSLDISEVVNTNLQSDSSQSEAVIAGKGVGSSQGSEKFEARDWGVLMCIYHNLPLLDYVISAPDPQLFVSQNTDLPIPELDSIGMQSIPICMYCNGLSELALGLSISDFTMGYLPRYYNWKTSYDYVLGSFTTTEKEWVAPITPAIWKNMLSTITTQSSSVTYNIFKVNPSVLDSIFQVNASSKWDTDPFLINCAFDVKVVRNLDYSGMPY